MKWSRRGARLFLGVLLTSLTLVVVTAVAAGAQTDVGTATTTTPTTVASGATSSLSSGQAFSAAIWALIFGVLAILFVLLFLSRDRVRSFKALLQLSRRGRVGVDDQAALQAADAGGGAGLAPDIALDAAGAPVFQIAGPDTVVVGQAVTFLAVGAAAGATPAWSVQGDATLSSASGASTRLTAQAVGAIYLSVKAGDTSAPKSISATSDAKDQTSIVPFLGSGYGSVVIALSVASVTAALGLTNVINGQAVAGILGSLVTYSVTRAATAPSNNGTPAGQAGANAGS